MRAAVLLAVVLGSVAWGDIPPGKCSIGGAVDGVDGVDGVDATAPSSVVSTIAALTATRDSVVATRSPSIVESSAPSSKVEIVRPPRVEAVFPAKVEVAAPPSTIEGAAPPSTIEVAAPPSTIRVALYDSVGVSRPAFDAARDFLSVAIGVEMTIVTARDVREGALDRADVAIFMGGSGTAQGRDLQPEGRAIVRDFVARGGGYIGVCAGAYLALQGEEEFHKLRIVGARNLTGDFWQRGIAASEIAVPGRESIQLFYANGPIFTPAEGEGTEPYASLGTYVSDIYRRSKGTGPGEMPGTPAIIATRFGKGRILLFSPNPLLGSGPVRNPAMMHAGIRWVATRGPVGAALRFEEVFGDGS